MRNTNKTESNVNIFLAMSIMWHCKDNSILSLFQYHCSSPHPNSLIPLFIFHSNTSHNVYLKWQSHARNPLFRQARAVHGSTQALTLTSAFCIPHILPFLNLSEDTRVLTNSSRYLTSQLTCYSFTVITVSLTLVFSFRFCHIPWYQSSENAPLISFTKPLRMGK